MPDDNTTPFKNKRSNVSDPIGRMVRKGEIDHAQEKAAERFIDLCERFEGGGLQSQKYELHVRSTAPNYSREHAIDAGDSWREVAALLGETDLALLRHVFHYSETYDAYMEENPNPKKVLTKASDREYRTSLIYRVCDALDRLAVHWKYASRNQLERAA